MKSKQSPTTLWRATVAVHCFPRDTSDVVVVIPREFSSGSNVLVGKESHPRESEIMRVHKYVLDEDIRLTRMLDKKESYLEHVHSLFSKESYVQVSPNIPHTLGIHNVTELIRPKKFTR